MNKMESLKLFSIIYAVLGLAVFYQFRYEYKNWRMQTALMKAILFIIAVNVVTVIIVAFISWA